MGHMAASELSSREGRARSHGTRGSTGAHLGREVRFRAKEHKAVPELNSARRRGPGPRDTWQHRSSPLQGGEVRAVGHVVAPDPTSVGRCGLKLQLAWQCVDARPAPCLHLELVCGVTRSLGCRQRPWAHLGRGCEPVGGANFLTPRLVILIFLLDS
jgi:hypothetical protein